MNTAPHLVNGDNNFAALSLSQAFKGDETFHLPLARAQSGTNTLAITLTSEDRSRAEALALINRRYAWRGYGADHKLSGNRSETTFTARFDDRLIGTVTLGTDSNRGLAVDETFPEEMQFFRRKQNARLCELKKLALENGSDAKPVLASLFHFVFIYGTNNCLGTDLLIEVNPRHAFFYERMLKFRRVGAVRTNASVDAPSQLMWLPVSDIDAAIDNNSDNSYNNSLYKYFYNRDYEDCIVNQINERALRERSMEHYY
jgi:hypothetical protein